MLPCVAGCCRVGVPHETLIRNARDTHNDKIEPGIMPQEKSRGISVAVAEQGRHSLINSINPKLAAYNRPGREFLQITSSK